MSGGRGIKRATRSDNLDQWGKTCHCSRVTLFATKSTLRVCRNTPSNRGPSSEVESSHRISDASKTEPIPPLTVRMHVIWFSGMRVCMWLWRRVASRIIGGETRPQRGGRTRVSKRNERFRHLTEGVGVDVDPVQDGNMRALSCSQAANVHHSQLVGICALLLPPHGSLRHRDTSIGLAGRPKQLGV